MNSSTSIILSAFFGLMAGVGHGILSHYAEFPVSLTDQLLEFAQVNESVNF